jgi:hypothetical protein
MFAPVDGEANVVLNWDPDGLSDLLPYAIGYRQAAERLWEDLEPRAGGAFADYEVLPLIFLLRHSIELGLKFATLTARGIQRLSGEQTPFDDRLLDSHNLEYLWGQLRSTLTTVQGARTVKDLDALRPVMLTLHRYDQGSFAFRYPIKKDATLSLPENFRFSMLNTIPNLVALAVAVEGIGHALDEQGSFVMQEYVDAHGARPPEVAFPRFAPPSA